MLGVGSTRRRTDNDGQDGSSPGASRSHRRGSKGGRSRLGHRRSSLAPKSQSTKLSGDDIEYLRKNTRYDEKEIKEWYKGFKADCPDGILDKTQVLDMYSMILPAGNANVFVDQIFRIFDKDGNGSIDFKEFMMATDMTASGSPEEKLRWAFKMYDKDGNGSVDLEEMIEIIGTLYDMEGAKKEHAEARAKKIFGELDVNGDGDLTADEFVKGCLLDPELVQLLNAGGVIQSDSDSDDDFGGSKGEKNRDKAARKGISAKEG